MDMGLPSIGRSQRTVPARRRQARHIAATFVDGCNVSRRKHPGNISELGSRWAAAGPPLGRRLAGWRSRLQKRSGTALSTSPAVAAGFPGCQGGPKHP
ncbi:hypothetical protein Acy02nite_75640 [Actinoplanes cyaneus]|uniref:Uncharacterized protein n=1 Tax=Actinoplanes cyaneus TaxID=52696 RepID=A0A919M9P7_9ACTN|nr:hypothetical protein Acy02nite_75640 [Actinoplanes cyaneus]